MSRRTLRVSASGMKHFEKTKLCHKFMNGSCRAGVKCPFAHGHDELKNTPDLTKTNLCPTFTATGSCPKGDRCTYAHGAHELRNSEVVHKSKLCWAFQQHGACPRGGACGYAHGVEELREANGDDIRERRTTRKQRATRTGAKGPAAPAAPAAPAVAAPESPEDHEVLRDLMKAPRTVTVQSEVSTVSQASSASFRLVDDVSPVTTPEDSPAHSARHRASVVAMGLEIPHLVPAMAPWPGMEFVPSMPFGWVNPGVLRAPTRKAMPEVDFVWVFCASLEQLNQATPTHYED